MKFTLIALSLTAFVVFAQAETSSVPTSDEIIKKVTDVCDEAIKSMEKLTGLKTDYDKNKVKEYLQKTIEKFEETYKKAKEFIEKNDFKNFPEETKKKIEDLFKQIQEQFKNLNSPEVQKSVTKFHETVTVAIKQILAAQTEFLKSIGLTIPPTMQKTINEIFDEILKSGEKLREKISKLLEDAQNELKKKKP